MIAEKILRFLASVDATHTIAEIQWIKEFNADVDSTQSINRKKTAQTGKLMSNIFPQNTIFIGKIIQIPSENRHTWIWESIFDKVDTLLQSFEQYTSPENLQRLQIISLPHLPSLQSFVQQKTIIISDFLRSQKQLNECILACKENKIRCVVIPLLTKDWLFTHPLQKKYPDYFRSI